MAAAEDAGGGRWRLRLLVQPGEGEPFEARAELSVADPAGPAVGGLVEVLHLPGRRGPVLTVGEPSRPPPPAVPAPPPGPAPDVGAVLGALARALGDGSLARGLPVVVRHDAPAPSVPEAGPLAGLSLDALAARAGDDPRAVLDEAARRVGAGEASPADLLAAARRAGLDRGHPTRPPPARRPFS